MIRRAARDLVRSLWDRLVAGKGSGSTRAAPTGGSRASVGPAPDDPYRTLEVDPQRVPTLRLSYAPERDGAPDAGEVVWTWVPYAENDGRGKDRPVLIIGDDGHGRLWALRLTSKSREGDRDFLPLGSGEWDFAGRPSWVDLDQLYSVHPAGMRREAAQLDPERFALVADALRVRHGWLIAEGG